MASFADLRQARGYNAEQFCAKAGISFSSLYRIEHDIPVSLLVAGRAAAGLGVILHQIKEQEWGVWKPGEPFTAPGQATILVSSRKRKH